MSKTADVVYLDNNATTRPDPAVVEAMLPYLTDDYANPSSGYAAARRVRAAIEDAREKVAAMLGCAAREIVFASGGTEAANLALHSALQLDARRQHVVTTAVEHSAVLRFCDQVTERGGSVTRVGVNEQGELDLDELESAIRPETAVVSVMWANNETGVISPVAEIAEIARRKGVLFHTDAVQAAGKLSLELRAVPANFVSISGHKIYGPKGVGALRVDSRVRFRPMLFGGSHEHDRRAGTENVAGIIGMGKAAELAASMLAEEQARTRALRDRFEEELLLQLPNVRVNGGEALRLTNTTSLSFADIDAAAALLLLDQAGLCCSATSACRTGASAPSYVLTAMGLGEERARSSLRFSFGRFNTEEDRRRGVAAVTQAVKKMRAMAAPPVVLST